jgi:hypothetical protein
MGHASLDLVFGVLMSIELLSSNEGGSIFEKSIFTSLERRMG